MLYGVIWSDLVVLSLRVSGRKTFTDSDSTKIVMVILISRRRLLLLLRTGITVTRSMLFYECSQLVLTDTKEFLVMWYS